MRPTARLRRWIATSLLVIFLHTTFAPAITYALTAGPTAPEYTSFEPVDTTDIVSLATGDFAYNLPLLEVPGPAGGYPISLSYHAGILPNEEASWAGLGFTVNAGSITRTVNGYPDDQRGAVRTREDFNAGGKTSTFSVGIGYAGASFQLSVSNDTNRGVGVGFGVGAEIEGPGASAVGISIGVPPYGGDPNVSLSLGIGRKGGNIRLTVGSDGSFNGSIGVTSALSSTLVSKIGLSTNFNNEVGMFADFYTVGSDMASNPTARLRGGTAISIGMSNTKANHWTTSSWGISVPIPIGASGAYLTLGYNYFRYHMHQTASAYAMGILHADQTGSLSADDWSLDSYALINADNAIALKDQEPEKSDGGSFPSYDTYIVNAQGLNGSMRPYILDNGRLFRQNVKDGDDYEIRYDSELKGYGFQNRINFRFMYDFSNSYAYSSNVMAVDDNNISFKDNLITPDGKGYDAATKKLAGSKNIEWYTNLQINNGEAKKSGFVDYPGPATRPLLEQGYSVAEQIGGYSITNENGVTYHYALPVYAYDEFSKSFAKDKPDKIYQNNFSPSPYAYTWLLTAITGSDFVDRNDNGIADDVDWGYWVSFDYGKWSNDYKWRNPSEGYHDDLDDDYQFYSRGTKEIYYLDAIKTKTHVAIFQKALRRDGKGLVDNGLTPSFVPAIKTANSETSRINPTQSLRLKNIYLLTRDQFAKAGGDDLKMYSGQTPCQDVNSLISGATFLCRVIDEGDNPVFLEENAIRTISFDHSYDLQKGTVNSFELSTPQALDGKLTLNAVHFKGKGSVSLIPPLRFEYGSHNPDYDKDAYDMWGFYKSDYEPMKFQNLERLVSDESAKNVDSWSLQKIITSLGSSIELQYESDKYELSPLSKTFQFTASSLKWIDDETVQLGLFKTQENVRKLLKESTVINLIAINGVLMTTTENTTDGNCSGYAPQSSSIWDHSIIDVNLTIQHVAEGSGEILLTIRDPGFAKSIKQRDDVIYFQARQIQRYQCPDNSVQDGSSCTVYDSNANQMIQVNGTAITCYVDQYITFSPTVIFSGNIGIIGLAEKDAAIEHNGGGLRVKEIALRSADGLRRSSRYSYAHGVTSYEPSGLNQVVYLHDWELKDDKKKAYAARVNERFSHLLQIAREVPPPGVLYKYVTVEEAVAHDDDEIILEGKKVYEFQVFEEPFLERIAASAESQQVPVPRNCTDVHGQYIPGCIPCGEMPGDPCVKKTVYSYTPMTLNDYSAWIGTPKSVSTYGADNLLLEQITNKYLHDNKSINEFRDDLQNTFNNQGLISQLFNEYKVIKNGHDYRAFSVYSKKSEYPLIMIGSTRKNYKTGVEVSTQNLVFDYFSGVPTKVLSTDSYGNRFVTETLPAYRVEAYSGMTAAQQKSKIIGLGLKVNNPVNKHMLTQVAASTTFQVDNNNVPIALLNSSIQTWSDHVPVLDKIEGQPGIWRKQSTYSWNGNTPLHPDQGTYDLADFKASPFVWLEPEASKNWKRNSSVTLYDPYSHAREEEDMNGHKATTLMDYRHERVIASAAPAGYYEAVYSGAENMGGNNEKEGGADRGQGNPSTGIAHSGKFSLLVAANTAGFNYTLESYHADLLKKYRASVWVYAPGEAESQQELNSVQLFYTVNGIEHEVHPKVQKNKSKSWYLLNLDIDPHGNNVFIGVRNNTSRGIYFDDFRIHPLHAAMTSYVYDKDSGELTYILDSNNIYTKYEYDALGRLTRASKELLNFDFGDGKESYRGDRILQEVRYNYGMNNK
jgi:hypothetical protein